MVNDVSESKLVEGNVEVEDSAILFAAFGTADTSTTEATDFIFQSISTCVIDSQSGSASAVDSATPTPKTPVKSRESSCQGSTAKCVYSIRFGSFPEGEDISTYAKFTKTDLDAQRANFRGDQKILKEKEVKKPLIKCEDRDGLTALRYDPKVAFGMQCKHLVFQVGIFCSMIHHDFARCMHRYNNCMIAWYFHWIIIIFSLLRITQQLVLTAEEEGT